MCLGDAYQADSGGSAGEGGAGGQAGVLERPGQGGGLYTGPPVNRAAPAAGCSVQCIRIKQQFCYVEDNSELIDFANLFNILLFISFYLSSIIGWLSVKTFHR